MIEDEREETSETKKNSDALRLIEKDNNAKTEKVPSTNLDIANVPSEVLSTADIEAISELSTSLSTSSAVFKEKAKLAILQANIDAVQSQTTSKSDLSTSGTEKDSVHISGNILSCF